MIFGGDDRDVLRGEIGNDTVSGDEGNDFINGGGGDDTLSGGAGNDTLLGFTGNDVIRGQGGDDDIRGEGGDDELYGDAGNDVISGGDGDDLINGAGGDDTLRGDNGIDQIQGGDGNDRLVGGSDNDTINGNMGDDTIDGGDGSDTLRGGPGEDNLLGGGGDDSLLGGEDDDLLAGGVGDDSLSGGNGNDQLFGQAGVDNLFGQNGDDLLEGETGNDFLNGGSGNDVVFGGVGDSDTMQGGEGLDRLLSIPRDNLLNVDASDAVIEFIDGPATSPDQVWSDAEVKTVDVAFRVIADRTNGGVKLLQNNGDGRLVQYRKVDNVEPSNVQLGDARLIMLTNWNNDDLVERSAAVASVMHQTALSWDTPGKINSVFPGQGFHVNQFRAVSQWSEGTEVPEGFVPSTDGEWYYAEGTEFLNEQGMINPSRDWATIWELALDFDPAEDDLVRLADKLMEVNQFFDAVSEP